MKPLGFHRNMIWLYIEINLKIQFNTDSYLSCGFLYHPIGWLCYFKSYKTSPQKIVACISVHSLV